VNKRVRVMIHGRVQGVYFRFYTQKKAFELALKGWVKNNADGTVAAVFEGEEDNVNQMVNWCHNGSPNAFVTQVDLFSEVYAGKETEFHIQY